MTTWIAMTAAVVGGLAAPVLPRPADLDARLEKLLALYLKYDLPLPPPDAPLIRYQAAPAGKDEPVRFELEFLVAPAKGREPPRTLFGTLEWGHDSPDFKYEVVKPDPSRFGRETWFTDPGFAIQCKHRGWHALARVALVRCLVEHREGAPSEVPYQELDFESLLHEMAWSYWTGQITKPGTDRKVILQMLKLVPSGRGIVTTNEDWAASIREEQTALIKSLELALVPSRAKPGSMDALIDDLLEATSGERDFYEQDRRPDPRYVKLAMQGFGAVPALIGHLNDDRLTRALLIPRGGTGLGGVFHLRVRDVVSDLLHDLAGSGRLTGNVVQLADAVNWWDEAKAAGEETYLIRHALTSGGDMGESPNQLMLKLLGTKYPARLLEVYRTMFSGHPNMSGWVIVRAVSQSSLPAAMKRAAFVAAVGCKSLDHRADALSALRPLDAKTADRLLKESLASLPDTPAGEYGCCPESRFAWLATKTTDPAVWKALIAAAKRADVGLRMQLLDNIGCPGPEPLTWKQEVRYLAAFLDDEMVRDRSADSARFDSPCTAGYRWERIAVRDFAAKQIARALKLKTEPESNWTAADWAKLRAEVRDAIRREGLR